jgi:hypothetical protein
VKIAVTETHIANGNQASDTQCALALAFESSGFNVSIGDDEVSFYEHGAPDQLCHHLADLPLPADARFWNTRLDMGQKVEPFDLRDAGDRTLRVPISIRISVPVPVV